MMKHRKVLGLISLGCPKNTVDSERLLGEILELGWELTDEPSDASCLVVNTCGFINDAILESEEAIEEVLEEKKSDPDKLVVVTGCLPQRKEYDLAAKYPEIDLIAGVGSLADLPSLIEKAWLDRNSVTKDASIREPGRSTITTSDSPRLRLTLPWTAYIKISEGCDHSCAFCTIPQIKGPHQSRTVIDILTEARMLADEGVRELILISQDTTAYGSDIGTNLRNLISQLDKIDGIDWIRLHYLYPSKISDSLLETIASSEHILPYFDIPIQHIAPEILKSMNRLGPDIDMPGLATKIRGRFEGRDMPACIRATLIAGYPGETEDHLAELLQFLEDARIDRLTVFQFSDEEGTHAHGLPDKVDPEVAEARVNVLMEVQQEISLEINNEWINKELDVLLEGFTDDGRRVGRSYRDAPEIDGLVIVSGVPDEHGPGEIVRTRIVGALPYDLEAEWVK